MNADKLLQYIENNFNIDVTTLEIIDNAIEYFNSTYNNKELAIKELYKAIFECSRIDLTLEELKENL